MKNEKEIELLNIDIATALMFIVTIIISIYLTYENRQDLLNRKRILNKKMHLIFFQPDASFYLPYTI